MCRVVRIFFVSNMMLVWGDKGGGGSRVPCGCSYFFSVKSDARIIYSFCDTHVVVKPFRAPQNRYGDTALGIRREKSSELALG